MTALSEVACLYPRSVLFSFHPQLGLDMEELEEIEEDAGLGNGGLGRLAVLISGPAVGAVQILIWF